MGGGVQQGLEAMKERRLGLKAQLLAQSRSKICSEHTKIAGMTGTALTEANEFFEVYGFDAVRSADQHAHGTGRRRGYDLPYPCRKNTSDR